MFEWVFFLLKKNQTIIIIIIIIKSSNNLVVKAYCYNVSVCSENMVTVITRIVGGDGGGDVDYSGIDGVVDDV